MANRQEFDRRARAIEELVRTLESSADAGLRATARELVQALMDLHRAGLERALELVDAEGETGRALIDRLAEDDIVKHLLVLHELQPLDLEARVHLAIDRARPAIAAGGGDVAHVAVDETGNVRVTLRADGGNGHGCGSPGASLKAIVEEAVYDTAPDIASMTIEVTAAADVPAAFIPIGNLRRRHPEGPAGTNGNGRSVAYP